jgi:hypothetical protein
MKEESKKRSMRKDRKEKKRKETEKKQLQETYNNVKLRHTYTAN